MLYCKTCNHTAAQGYGQCSYCGNGFVSVLTCATCQQDVPRGMSCCSRCDRQPQSSARDMVYVPPPVQQFDGMIPLPVQRLATVVPQAYDSGRFGANSRVEMNGDDALILTRVGQFVQMLHAMAGELSRLQGHMQSTRSCIKGCRNLATELQEEIETRLGPKG